MDKMIDVKPASRHPIPTIGFNKSILRYFTIINNFKEEAIKKDTKRVYPCSQQTKPFDR